LKTARCEGAPWLSTASSYIPGGQYPLLPSARMTILTTKVASIPHVIDYTPPVGGAIPPATVALENSSAT
jgi:sulfopropanediol 3-dehydrogenase